jgi:predicted SAM-dependent methyltransferase
LIFLSARTWASLKFDLLRLRVRIARRIVPRATPAFRNLHFGCGDRRINGWLNVDVAGSDCNVDLAGGCLPWPEAVFDVIVGQQVIEHLELASELLPLLEEFNRVSRKGAEIWLSCPDMEKICRSYLDSRGADLISDRRTRIPEFSMGDSPSQHIINDYFHQNGQHKNLYDYEMLGWALRRSGFGDVVRTTEVEFLARFPDFPPRHDDYVSLYVRAVAT